MAKWWERERDSKKRSALCCQECATNVNAYEENEWRTIQKLNREKWVTYRILCIVVTKNNEYCWSQWIMILNANEILGTCSIAPSRHLFHPFLVTKYEPNVKTPTIIGLLICTSDYYLFIIKWIEHWAPPIWQRQTSTTIYIFQSTCHSLLIWIVYG